LLDGAKITLDAAGGVCAGFAPRSLYWRSKGVGDDGGEILARMLQGNVTCLSVDVGMCGLWRDAGKAMGEMLATNSKVLEFKTERFTARRCTTPPYILTLSRNRLVH
jgi:hypothetical protein